MNADQFRTRLAEVLEEVPDYLKKPIQQFCSELRQEQRTLKERLESCQRELEVEKQDRLRLAREAADYRQEAGGVKQALANAQSKGLCLGKALSAQAETIAKLKRCPGLAIPEEVDLCKINYDLLAVMANGKNDDTIRINNGGFAAMKRHFARISTFHKLPKFKAWWEKLSREQMTLSLFFGFSKAILLERLCARYLTDMSPESVKLFSD